ncbi:hypothetical protein ACFFX1_28310 [Dactylosporangium sucinum]|uniref:Uncharacterized protein n=1 Tax=Dactylosporangium sucinum TaxID=1424081 RepID=A0A917U624_9ACTN|nr:hypothetical protein [Dactylosporangium sucinum]GGM60795.1 hypothetical protein GCM10007977_072860 [Dactylosporangium sucinum]
MPRQRISTTLRSASTNSGPLSAPSAAGALIEPNSLPLGVDRIPGNGPVAHFPRVRSVAAAADTCSSPISSPAALVATLTHEELAMAIHMSGRPLSCSTPATAVAVLAAEGLAIAGLDAVRAGARQATRLNRAILADALTWREVMDTRRLLWSSDERARHAHDLAHHLTASCRTAAQTVQMVAVAA